jgi:hypothetical protein
MDSPRSIEIAVKIAPNINSQNQEAKGHRAANDEPRRQIWIHNRIKDTDQKRARLGI